MCWKKSLQNSTEVVFKDLQLHRNTMGIAKDHTSTKLIKLCYVTWKYTGRFAESKKTAQKSRERRSAKREKQDYFSLARKNYFKHTLNSKGSAHRISYFFHFFLLPCLPLILIDHFIFTGRLFKQMVAPTFCSWAPSWRFEITSDINYLNNWR